MSHSLFAPHLPASELQHPLAAVSIVTAPKAVEVPTSFGLLVLRRRGLVEDAFDALGRKVELDERDAAIEGFAVMRDQPVAEMKAADAFEQDGASGGFRQQRRVAEPETRVSHRPVAHGSRNSQK